LGLSEIPPQILKRLADNVDVLDGDYSAGSSVSRYFFILRAMA